MNQTEPSKTVKIDLLDVVAVTKEITAGNLPAGAEGTVVDVLSTGAFEVEFTDSFGNTIYEGAVRPEQLRLVYSAVRERGTTEATNGPI